MGRSLPPISFQLRTDTGKDRGQLVLGQLRQRVGGMDHHGQAVEGDRDLLGFEALLPGHFHFFRFELARKLGDVAGIGKQSGDAGARTAAGDGHRHLGIRLHELFGPGLAQVDHGVRTLDLNGIPLLALPAAASQNQNKKHIEN